MFSSRRRRRCVASCLQLQLAAAIKLAANLSLSLVPGLLLPAQLVHFPRPSSPPPHARPFHSNRRDGSTNQQDVGIKLAQNGKQTRRVVKSTCPTKRWTNRTMEDGEKKSKHGRRGQRHTRLHSSRHSACLNPPSLTVRSFLSLLFGLLARL